MGEKKEQPKSNLILFKNTKDLKVEVIEQFIKTVVDKVVTEQGNLSSIFTILFYKDTNEYEVLWGGNKNEPEWYFLLDKIQLRLLTEEANKTDVG